MRKGHTLHIADFEVAWNREHSFRSLRSKEYLKHLVDTAMQLHSRGTCRQGKVETIDQPRFEEPGNRQKTPRFSPSSGSQPPE